MILNIALLFCTFGVFVLGKKYRKQTGNYENMDNFKKLRMVISGGINLNYILWGYTDVITSKDRSKCVLSFATTNRYTIWNLWTFHEILFFDDNN